VRLSPNLELLEISHASEWETATPEQASVVNAYHRSAGIAIPKGQWRRQLAALS